MESRRWINQSQPQTLYIAVFLLYADAAFAMLYLLLGGGGGLFSLVTVATAGGSVAAGYGIANERKWGYWLGVVMSFMPATLRVLFLGVGGLTASGPISLLFEIALIALLLHPMSRDYQRVWFK